MLDNSGPSKTTFSGLAGIKLFARQHWVTVLVGIMALVVVNITALPNGNLMDPLQTRNVVRILLIGTFFILLIFGRHDKYQLFRVTNSALVPISAALLFTYIWLDAPAADGLAREDKLIEDFSFLFSMVGAACLGLVAILLARKREFVTMLFAGVAALVFFVIGMEEVSWLQRELDRDSSEFFRNLNSQGETNFHNLYTHESEDIFYLGGFLLLVVFPYFRNQLGQLLDRIGLTSARVLLPPFWLILPFVLAGAFVSQGFFSRAANVTIVLGSFIILLGVIQHHLHRKEWGSLTHAVTTFLLMPGGIVLLLSQDFLSQEVRPWIGKEYQEFYIAWGLAAYGVAVVHQFFDQERQPSRRPTS